MPKAEFDEQGKLFWHRAMKAGWTEKRVNAYLLKAFNATHWNALDSYQKRAALSTINSYLKKKQKEESKALRQKIMALVTANGHDLEWMHDLLISWGKEPSLRKLDPFETQTVYDSLKAMFPGRVPGGDTEVIEDGVTYEYNKLKGYKSNNQNRVKK